MRWYDWRIWRLARAKQLRADRFHEADLTWKHLGHGFYWAFTA